MEGDGKNYVEAVIENQSTDNKENDTFEVIISDNTGGSDHMKTVTVKRSPIM